jgi:single-stranded-DNA-specific exonuclease
MAAAVQHMLKAIGQGKPIVVFGDYDADGVSSTALLTEAIRDVGGSAIPYLPNRFEEGYGLNNDAISRLWQQGGRLLVTVDCGIRGNSQVDHARKLGFEVIVTDHHHPGGTLPAASAIVNPRQEGDSYPFKELAGVGLSYKLAGALRAALGRAEPQAGLDLVALGTVADLAPLHGENRVLVTAGLEQINRRSRPGLAELASVSGLEADVSAVDIGYRLGPRINAAGRMESADEALALLLTEDRNEARQLAAKLDSYNRQRQDETRQLQEEAERELLRSPEEASLLFAVGADFHEGVVGLAASRLLERYYRPVLVASRNGDIIKGSARSIPSFHITDALERCSDLLLEFGGHAAAAGFQLHQDNLDEFYARMNEAAELQFQGELPQPELPIDAVVQPGDLGESLLAQLEGLKPYGHGNPAPTFAARRMKKLEARPVGSNGSHLKMTVSDGHNYFDAIGFGLGGLSESLPPAIGVAFHFEWNEFRGRRTPQLNIVDVKEAG